MTNETKKTINTMELSAEQVRNIQFEKRKKDQLAVFEAEKEEFYYCLKKAIEHDETEYDFQREFSSMMKRFLDEKGFDWYERYDSRNQVTTVVSWRK